MEESLCKGIPEVHALKRIQVQRLIFMTGSADGGGGLMMLVLSKFTRLYLV